MGPQHPGQQPVTVEEVKAFLTQVGVRFPQPAVLYLVGGGALLLLGLERPTFDVDYIGTDIPGRRNDLERLAQEIADELRLDVEAVPFQEMIPLLSGANDRHLLLGQFGKLTVYAFDPVSLAVSKLDRGFEYDLEDVLFLLKRRLIALTQLEQAVAEAIPSASQYDLHPQQMRKNLDIVRRMFGQQGK